MSMRSTVFRSGQHRVDTSIIEPDNLKQSRKFTANVLSTIHNSENHQHPRNKAKISCQCRDQSPTRREEENWETQGALTHPSTKQMGAEGSLNKSKSLFCQTSHSHVAKMDPMESNGSNQRRDGGVVAGVPSPENSPDGKHRNVRKGPGLVDPQTSCIRQILLLQLELMEQQQKQLHSKNKEIDDLKAEKEMLKARIERMERRLEMVKKDGGESRPSQTPRRKEPETETATSDEAQRETEGKDLKKRFPFQDTRMSRTRRGQPKSPLPPSPEEDPAVKEEPQEKMGPELQTQSEELLYVDTTEMCHCCCHQPQQSLWHDSTPVHEDNVVVPSWRENIVKPLGQKEASDIPECLDDSVFLKRHSKLELDEKRRKRWDIQRIREQRMFQRLQQRMNKRKMNQESEPEVVSFYPNPEDVESIMVTPFLPVVAFGRPLPNPKQQDFKLPWLNERSTSRAEVPKKRTPHRTCRK